MHPFFVKSAVTLSKVTTPYIYILVKIEHRLLVYALFL